MSVRIKNLTQLKKGDRIYVIATIRNDSLPLIGSFKTGAISGKVLENLSAGGETLVQFDVFINGHDGGHPRGKNGYCWWIYNTYLLNYKIFKCRPDEVIRKHNFY